MDVGGVGSAGGSAASVGATPQAPTATPEAGAPLNVQSNLSEAGNEAPAYCGDGNSGMVNTGLSTQDFFQLHQTVRGASASSGTNFDMQKLLELIIAMKLLEQASK